ncbi:hypothetical protein HKX48_005453 [Thoreauomyces humboldtii]|nr:hypothetical protein HKX48_005453 [Thoreauomyces humboldtii]
MQFALLAVALAAPCAVLAATPTVPGPFGFATPTGGLPVPGVVHGPGPVLPATEVDPNMGSTAVGVPAEATPIVSRISSAVASPKATHSMVMGPGPVIIHNSTIIPSISGSSAAGPAATGATGNTPPASSGANAVGAGGLAVAAAFAFVMAAQ